MVKIQRLLYSVLGNAQKLDGGAMFGNAPKPLWSRWSPTDQKNRIDLACRCLLIKEANRRVLLETGVGAFFSPKYKERYGIVQNHHVLLNNLNQLNLTDSDIDVVVLSHLHFDHAGGLLSAYRESEDYKLLFPNARYVVSKANWDRACNPHPRDKASFVPILQQLLKASGRLEIVNGKSSTVLGPEYQLHFSNGHTPGLMLTEIPSQNGPILFASDLIPGRAWVNQSITMGYDRYPELLIDEKTKLIEYLHAQNGRLFFTHDPSCAITRITKDERGKFGTVNNTPNLQAFEV